MLTMECGWRLEIYALFSTLFSPFFIVSRFVLSQAAAELFWINVMGENVAHKIVIIRN